MDLTLLLSGAQLLELKCLYQEMKKMSRKRRRVNSDNNQNKRENIPSSSEMKNIEKDIERQLNERFTLLGNERVRLSHDMGAVEWCPSLKLGKVISTKKRSPWMGFKENKQLMFTPEETIFLMEAECIIVHYMGAPMSLQAGYQMILADNQLGKVYQMYAYLTRLGYKLKSLRAAQIPLVPEPDSTLKRQTKDDLDEKMNQLRSRPIQTKSNIDTSRLVKMALRRGMFLNGTSFDKTATWSEYKRLIQPRDNPSVIFDEEATVLELNDEIRCSENIFDHLPNNSLIDQTNNLSPLIDQTKGFDINKLHEKMKESGPRETNLHQLLPPSSSQPLINYQVFLPSVKKFNNIQPDHLLVCCTDRYTPMIQELMTISNKSGQSTPIFGVMSHSEFNFNTLEAFNLWDEIPTSWDPNIKR